MRKSDTDEIGAQGTRSDAATAVTTTDAGESTSVGDPNVNTSVFLRAATLEGFVAAASMADVITLRDVEPLTTLIVVTRNSRYRIIVNCSTNVLIQGGQFFPDRTPAQLDGASFGGSFLMLGVIAVGLCMEIRSGHERIITSPVRAIAEEKPSTCH